MIEILFSDSARGSLKVAQRFGKGQYVGSCTSVFIIRSDGSAPSGEEIEAAQREHDEKHRLAWEKAVPLGGNPADVYGFSLTLSIGDISEDEPGPKRFEALERLYSIYPGMAGSELDEWTTGAAHTVLAELRERITAGEAARIWYSNQPDDMCGLYWFMTRLREWKANNAQLFLVRLPEWEADGEKTIRQRSGWGELSPGEWRPYLDMQVPAPPAFIGFCAAQWRTLQKENAPLRAVLNGRLVSVPEDVYDSFILREIEAEAAEFRQAMIVGRVLGKYQLGIGDAWIALRIEEMIRAGTLEALSSPPDDMPLYHRMLRKCTRL